MTFGHRDALQRGRPSTLGSSDRRDDAPSRTEGEGAPISQGHRTRLRGGQGKGGLGLAKETPEMPARASSLVLGRRCTGRAGAGSHTASCLPPSSVLLGASPV